MASAAAVPKVNSAAARAKPSSGLSWEFITLCAHGSCELFTSELAGTKCS
eukprot:CAMPEP_0197683206 /NCGR_PEP_ID=MMETSP1338-20131121/97589_1 /TAXON_ID=43686 ORGANISM="Pelagodinium beii, Strain RCC1491" /NCGR_SAMPLE_ID=MMETSP1338 /ASSEMBLY_ACC=CAM_ASM_000754 /LENGTH=49 /DNA_ID= /DNA_START= /DNA_END= /DNA_ORIENTATION=